MNSFLYTVAEDIIHRFGKDLKDVAIVFNNKRPIVFLKKYLSEISNQPIFSPAFFTIQSFIAKSTQLVQADFMVRFFILHETYNELLKKEQKEGVSPDDFLPMAEIILRDFDQIDFDMVDPNAIYSYLKDLAVIDQQFPLLTEEQQAYLNLFWSSFSTDRQIYIQQKFIELWTRLPLLYEQFHQKLREQNLTGIASTYRDFANGKGENRDFVDRYKKLVFIGFNALNKAEVKLFKQWQKDEKAIFYFDADSYYMDDKIQEAGHFLRINKTQHQLINALGEFPSLLNQVSKKIEIYPVLGHVAQAKVLTKILAKSTYSSAETAIVLADESLLIPVLQTLPNDLKINITMGFPLNQSPIFGLIDLWLQVQERYLLAKERRLKKEFVLAFIAHPLSGISDTERKDLLQIISENRSEEISMDALIFSLPHAKEFFSMNVEGLATLSSLEKMIAALYEWRLESKHLHLIESSLLIRITKVLNQLSDSLYTYYSKTSLQLILSFIKKAMAGIAAPIEGEPLDGIQVMGMLESRCLDFDEVIILGANEGVLPQLSLSPTFIPDSLRRAFGLPILENQDALSAYLFYRLLQRAKKVSVIYNNLVESNSTGEVSRFLQQLLFESQLESISFPQKQIIQLSSPIPNLKIEKTPAIMAKLEAYLQPNGTSFSASALLTYLKCPLEFFFKYIAGFKEPDRSLDELDGGSIGSMVHAILEDFYQEFLKRNTVISKEDIRLKMSDLPKLCKKALSNFMHLDSSKAVKFSNTQLIALSIIEENARVILDYDAKYVAPFRMIELENKNDYTCRFPVEINGVAQHINLYAIIDRIDEVKGQKRIVDYKTGSDRLEFSLEAICDGSHKNFNRAAFQSLLYSLIYENVKKVANVETHLYVLRQLQNGSILVADKRPLEGSFLGEVKQQFRESFHVLLTEIFNPEIPFMHNENSIYCHGGFYSQFCHPSGLVNTKEEEVGNADR
jgi:hypothetical protein